MALETITGTSTPNDLVATNPVSTDTRREGDDHIRNIKAVLQQMDNLAVYADNAAAKVGGLTDGDLYRLSTGEIMVVFT
jgi:hypothetical protein